jgi:hypothetical protein
MMDKTCATCTYAVKRVRSSRPQLWCKAHGCIANRIGCIDHKTKPSIITALRFYKALAIK